MSRGPPSGKCLQNRYVVCSKVSAFGGALCRAPRSQTLALLLVFRCMSRCSQTGCVLLLAVAARNAPACCAHALFVRRDTHLGHVPGVRARDRSSNTWPRFSALQRATAPHTRKAVCVPRAARGSTLVVRRNVATAGPYLRRQPAAANRDLGCVDVRVRERGHTGD